MLSLFLVLYVFTYQLCSAQNIQNDFLVIFRNHQNLIERSLENKKISKDCIAALTQYYEGLETRVTWAMKMFDAKTKVPSGISNKIFFDWGDFDKCLEIDNEETKGKYCLSTYSFNADTLWILNKTESHFAICVPSTCTTEDISEIYIDQQFEEKYCYSKETMSKIDGGAITALIILGFFGLIVILSTSYDIWLHFNRYKPGSDITIAFSYFTNGKKLLSSFDNSDDLMCLNGIKALSTMWIVIGHEYLISSGGPITNYPILNEMRHKLANMFIIQASLAAETFFVIGGVVTTYSFLKVNEQRRRFSIFQFYIHKYIRLTPVLAVVVMAHANLLTLLGSGPLWSNFEADLVKPCQKYWWSSLLYIQNYVNNEEVCVPQAWFLCTYMQLLFLSPIVLIPLKKYPKWALTGLFILSLTGIIVPFTIAFIKEFNAFSLTETGPKNKNFISLYYFQTYARFTPYTMGMILGLFIHKIKKQTVKIKMKWLQVIFVWFIFLGGGLACAYSGHDTMISEYNKWAHSLYIALNRPAWALAVCGIIFLCVGGYGGSINIFLSSSVLQFISKISYSIYLTHYAMICLRVYSYKTTFTMGHYYMFFNFWGDFIFCLIISVVLHLTFESPLLTIEKLILEKVEQRGKKATIIFYS